MQRIPTTRRRDVTVRGVTDSVDQLPAALARRSGEQPLPVAVVVETGSWPTSQRLVLLWRSTAAASDEVQPENANLVFT
jgi:hypothetical protein